MVKLLPYLITLMIGQSFAIALFKNDTLASMASLNTTLSIKSTNISSNASKNDTNLNITKISKNDTTFGNQKNFLKRLAYEQNETINYNQTIKLQVKDLTPKSYPNLRMMVLQIPRQDNKTLFTRALMLWDEKNSMNDNMAAIIHNHGGGGVKGTMWDNLEGLFYRDLMKEDFVLFLVDYRLAPQYKSPAGQTDCYQVIKYVHSHANELGIDQSRIALAGESAGAYIAAGAMEMLMNDPEDKQIPMIKNLILIMPMINDHLLKANITELNSYEKPKLDEVKYYYNQLANNLQQQSNDPLLFPGKMNEQQIKSLPQTILVSSDQDFLRKDAMAFKSQLEKNHRLAEFLDYSGVGHMFMLENDLPQTTKFVQEYQNVLRKLLI